MRRFGIIAILLVPSLLLIATPQSAHATWDVGGTILCDASGSQYQYVTVSDGAGGAIVVFIDDRYGNPDIFAQRVDKNGNLLWDSSGVPICTVSATQGELAVVSDGLGGAIITWLDNRGTSSDIYAQRIDANGVRLWNSLGLVVCAAVGTQYYPRITTDGAGGAILLWEDLRDGTRDLYARRVDINGTGLWNVTGVQICSQNFQAESHRLVSDGLGGAYIVWEDLRSGHDIYYDRVDEDGTLWWGSDGLAVCDDPAIQSDPQAVFLMENSIVTAWRDYRSGPVEIYGQRLDGLSGQWGSDGTQLLAITESANLLRMTIDKEATMFFVVETNTHDIVAQQLLSNGSLPWGSAGVLVRDAAFNQSSPQILSDDVGGSIIVWSDNPTLGAQLVAQRVDETGTLLWDPNGVSVAPGFYGQRHSLLVPDGAGGAIAVWTETRTDLGYDVLGQRIDRNGYIASPEPTVVDVLDVPNDQGGRVEIRWDASYLDPWPYQEISHYSIWKSLSAASAMTLLGTDGRLLATLGGVSLEGDGAGVGCPVVRQEMLGETAFYWELVGTQPAQYYDGYAMTLATDFDSTGSYFAHTWYQVAAHTADPFVVWTSEPDSGYSVDDLAPAAPLGLAGQQVHSPTALDLSWIANSEPDLSHYVVYRGTVPTFAPSTATYLSATTGESYLDGEWSWSAGYWYKVSAVDVHGNESFHAVLGPDVITGIAPGQPEFRDYLAQNVPNPFNPTTAIAFGLSAPGHVTLRIYDAAGGLVATVLDETMEAGPHAARWDGLATNGERVASGVYFYRLRSDSFERTRKMTLLR